MRRTWLRRAIVIVTASVVLPVTFPFAAQAAVSASAARAADPGADRLAAAMVQTDDLPAGFQPYVPLTGPLNAERAQVLAVDISQLGAEAKWVPPVRAEDLQRRWQEFQHEGARLWPFTVPGPVADPHALVLAFRHPRWTVIGADRRTEWSYGAALRQARTRSSW